MRVKRLKTARKFLTFYKKSFGIFEPYQVLVDLTFCQAALQTKINIKEQLPKYLNGAVQLLTTKCNNEEGNALGPQLKGARLIAQRFQCRNCGHKKALTATECIKSIVGATNPKRYFVATQDKELRNELHKVPGVPLLFITYNALVLERPSEVSQMEAEELHQTQLEPSGHEKETLTKLKASLPKQEVKPKRKRKRPAGPNPLSVKKKKKGLSYPTNETQREELKHKRKRKRRKIPDHVKTALGLGAVDGSKS